MALPLESEIRRLQEFYWSDADPHGRGFVSLADALRRAGDLMEAHRLLRDGLRRHPALSSGHIVAAWVHLERGQEEAAEKSFRAALELDPRNVAALGGLADLLISRGDLEEAVSFLHRLAEEDPLDPELESRIQELEERLSRGEAELPAGLGAIVPTGEGPWLDPEAAAQELDWEHASLQPDSSEVPGPSEEPAVAAAEGAVEGRGPETLVSEAAESGMGEAFPSEPAVTEESFGDFWVAEEGVPLPVEEQEDTLLTPTLGEIYLRQGIFDRAEEVFERLLERDPGNEMIAARLAEARARRAGEWSEAEEVAEVVPVEALAPEEAAEVVPVEALAPEEAAEVVPVEALAPEEAAEVVPVETLAPEEAADVVPVEALAPEEAAEVVPIEALAPEEAARAVPVESLAPDRIVPIESLAPDRRSPPSPPEGSGGARPERDTLDSFQKWLDSLQ